MSVFDLNWNLAVTPGPEPEPSPSVPPIAVPGADLGAVEKGCGILTPFARNGKGDWRNGCGIDIIRSSVERILGVGSMSDFSHGEIPWQPEFGSLVRHLRHKNANLDLANLARYRVMDALRIWEPRIEVLDATAEFVERAEPGAPTGTALEIKILYNILAQLRGSGTLVSNIQQNVTLPTAA